jgi:hypothetical protein
MSSCAGRSGCDESFAQNYHHFGAEEAMSLLPLDDECSGSLLRCLRLRLYRHTICTAVSGTLEKSDHRGRSGGGRGGDDFDCSEIQIAERDTGIMYKAGPVLLAHRY